MCRTTCCYVIFIFLFITLSISFIEPGDVLNIHIPEDGVTTSSISVTWWGVEGASKSVDVTLTRLRKNNDDQTEIHPTVIKEERVLTEEDSASQVEFTGLEANTVYGIRLRASSRGDVGNESIFTQSTNPEKIEILPDVSVNNASRESTILANEIKVAEKIEKQSTPEEKPNEQCLTESRKELDIEKSTQQDNKNEEDKATIENETTVTQEETPAIVTAISDVEKENELAPTETTMTDELKSAAEQITEEPTTEDNIRIKTPEIVPVTKEPQSISPSEKSNSPSPPQEPKSIVKHEVANEETDLKPSFLEEEIKKENEEENQPLSVAKNESKPDSSPTEKEPPLQEKDDLDKENETSKEEEIFTTNKTSVPLSVPDVTATPEPAEPVHDKPRTPTPDLPPVEKSPSPEQLKDVFSGKDIKPVFVLSPEKKPKDSSREHSPKSPKKIHQPSKSPDLPSNTSSPLTPKKTENQLSFLATLTSSD